MNGIEFLKLTSNYKNILKIVFGHVHCQFKTTFMNQQLISCLSTSFQIPIETKTNINIQYDTQGYVQLYSVESSKSLNIEILKISN